MRQIAPRVAEEFHLQSSRLLEAIQAGGELPALLALSERLSKEIGHLQSAIVHDARAGGATWNTVATAAQVSPTTARDRWNETQVQRRMERRDRERPADAAQTWLPHPRTSTEGPPAVDGNRSGEDETIARASGKLAAALSFLHRRSALRVRDVAETIELSPSYLSRILTGERPAAWPVVETLATTYGADPLDLRYLWEISNGTAQAPRDSIDTAGDRLRAALRGLHLAAGSPQTAQVRAWAPGHLMEETITEVLHGRSIPNWPQTSRLVTALGGVPADVRPLWEALHYSFLVTIEIPPAPAGQSQAFLAEQYDPDDEQDQ